MGYNRIATHNCPGLIILIVDGSSTPLLKGNIIDRSDTDSLANRFISEWIQQLTYGEDCIFDDLYICCIIRENGKSDFSCGCQQRLSVLECGIPRSYTRRKGGPA